MWLSALERLVGELVGRGGTWFAPLADVARHVRPLIAAPGRRRLD